MKALTFAIRGSILLLADLLITGGYNKAPLRHASPSVRAMVGNMVDYTERSSKSLEFSQSVIQDRLPFASIAGPDERATIERRQLGRRVAGLFAVEKVRCKHGYPRAFVSYPVSDGISSGMLRLSCPHLVKAIDEIERKGAIDEFDAVLQDKNLGKGLRQNFEETNKAWRDIRYSAVTEEDRQMMDKKLGVEGAANLMESGIIGCTPGKLQVKCLHAHVADQLLRGTNEIGAMTMKRLEAGGVDTKGCDGKEF
jgi:hypothetical protein